MVPYGYSQEWRLVVLPRPENQPAHRVLHTGGLHPTVFAELHRSYGGQLQFELVSAAALERATTEVYESSGEAAASISASMAEVIDLGELDDPLSDTHDLLQEAAEAPIIRLINAILSEATQVNASDVHIETFEQRVSIRYRVDGMLRDSISPNRELAQMLASRIKVMAKLDIAEKRLPQDGRMTIKVAGRLLDVRVSTLPTQHGERLVLRLLEKEPAGRSLEQLGMSAAQNSLMENWLQRPHGVILVTGPTGSGKSTTLYAALEYLNHGALNILTVEDPVEIDLDGVGQTQVNPKIKLDFARGLRAILRQDPDVVMVGEIRDPETAASAIQASLTGHLVLSTLHTNTALGAIPRLIELGVQPFLLSSSLTGLLAQRLVRTLCRHCATPYSPGEIESLHPALAETTVDTLYRAQGCRSCAQTGYSGRTAVYDLVPVDESLRATVHSATHDPNWQRFLEERSNGLLLDGIAKATQGITTLEEVLRVAGTADGEADW